MRITVLHAYKGCETGCCGHVIEIDGEREGTFVFDHPYGEDQHRAFAEALVRNELGEEHVADLDWENCEISDD